MYDELIRQMRACCNGEPCEEANCGFNSKSDLDCIEQLLTRAAKAIEDLDNKLNLYRQGKISRWIPVTERLPEKYTRVLVYSKRIRLGRNIDFMNEDGDWHTIPEVSYWMPLPEPPKDGEA